MRTIGMAAMVAIILLVLAAKRNWTIVVLEAASSDLRKQKPTYIPKDCVGESCMVDRVSCGGDLSRGRKD